MKYVKLGDICEFINGDRGKNYPSGKDFVYKGIPFINAGHIQNNNINFENMNYISREKFNVLGSGKVKKNDILYCLRGSLGKNAIVNIEEGAIASSLVILRPKDELIDVNYLIKYLNSNYINEQILKANNGSSQPNLSATSVKKFSIFLPNYEQQKEISRLLGKSQELIDKRKTQIEALDELVKSRFIEMFGDPISNSKQWNTEKMNDIAPVVNYKGEVNEDKIWLLNLDMVESNTGRVIDYIYVTKDEIGSSTCTFDTTNVLYSKLRPYLNKVVIPTEIGYATSEMVPLQPKIGVLNRYYLTYMLRNKSFVDYISEKVAGAKMPRVSMGDFRTFEVPIPTIELQNQFAEFVNQVDKLKFEMEKSLKELEDNFNSLMQRAFRGELFE